MLFKRTTHDHLGHPRHFPDSAHEVWRSTPAGLIGHMLECERWLSLDRTLAQVRLQEAADSGPHDRPAGMCELMVCAGRLLHDGMIAGDDSPHGDEPFLLVRADPTAPDRVLHPVSQAVLDQLDRNLVSLEILRDRLNRSYPGSAQITIEDTLLTLGELLLSGHVAYSERRVTDFQDRISDRALARLLVA